MQAKLKLMIHVQLMVGTGHLRRMLAVASAAAEAGWQVRLLSGGMPLPGGTVHSRSSGFDVVQLAPARSADNSYSGLVDEHGQLVDAAWQAARCESVLAEFERFRPDMLLVETWPFGRRLIEFELLPLLARARAHGCARVCSIRDVLEPRDRLDRVAQMLARAADLDGVLVHGDPGLLPLETSFLRGAAAVDLVRERVHYTGYISAVTRAAAAAREAAQRSMRARDDSVLVTAGGGAIGSALCRATARAADLDPGRSWHLFTGQNLPQADYQALQQAAPVNLTIDRFSQDLPDLLARCAVSVSQAGYNTAVELLEARCPSLLVPYTGLGEREQSLRSDAFAAAGLAQTLICDGEIPAQSLLDGITRVFDSGVPDLAALGRVDLDGARTTARVLQGIALAR